MGLFDYKGADARAAAIDAFAFAGYAQPKAVNGLADVAAAAIPGFKQYETLKAGWRDLTPDELGLSASTQDGYGNYTGETSRDPQARVLGHVGADGKVDAITLAFAGTSGPGDVADYFNLVRNQYMEEFRYLLDAVAAFGRGQGLTGEDVTVTGYSLGGGATNVLAQYSSLYAGGFFDEAHYFGFSSPNIYDNADRILNFGAENDVVYRSIGTSNDSVPDGLIEALLNEDKPFESAADNVVLFNDLYANPLSPFGPFSIANLPGGWNAHLTGLFSPVIETITGSHFYDQTARDSVIVVSQLSDALRPVTWVGDVPRITSGHYGDPAFILGTAKDDLLMDGARDDFLEGFGGNDRFRLSGGNDAVHGGAGWDTAELSGAPGNYEAMRLSDGTVFLRDRTERNGVDELISVEQVRIGGLGYDVGARGLESHSPFAADLRYASVREGGAGADRLVGTWRDDRLFGLGGDDRIEGGDGRDLLHGGAGNDMLLGGAGNDTLLGGAGDDHLVGGLGDDLLSGGTGNDLFDFTAARIGADRVTDFNAGAEGHDRLLFAAGSFASADAVIRAFHQDGEDAVLEWSAGSVRLLQTDVASLGSADILFA